MSTPTLRTTMPRHSHHGHHLRASVDLSAFHSPLAGRGAARPNSEIYLSQIAKNKQAAAAAAAASAAAIDGSPTKRGTLIVLGEQLDEWERELQNYEATLEEMANASLDMKEELGAVEQWFRVLTEAERTAALYSLLQQATQVQIRFFLTVLQQMASKTPVNQLLSPASFEKGTEPLWIRMLTLDAMQRQLSSAMSQLSFDNTPKRMSNTPVSPSPRNSRHLDASTIQAMFPDAAAALAHQRTLLNSNRNSMNGLPAPTASVAAAPRSPGLQAAKDAWPTSSTETPIAAAKIRPRSADIAWQAGNAATATPTAALKSPPAQVQHTPHITEDLTSPFGIPGGASWASMVNTPVVPMFQNPHTMSQRGDEMANAAAMKLAAWNANKSSVSGGIINLDSDVRKFRRGRAAQPANQGDPLSTSLGGRDTSPTNILMYDEHGQLLQFSPHQLAAMSRTVQSPLTAQQPRSRPTSPYPPGFAQFQTLGIQSPVGLGVGQQTYLQPYDGSSPILSSADFAQGYLSDHTSDRRGNSSPSFPRGKYAQNNIGQKRSTSTGKHVEDPVDPSLLNDIPGWLRSLRLHKYTENLADVKGGVLALALLTDEDLEKRGVSAVGARRKLLKCFEQVRGATGTPNLNE